MTPDDKGQVALNWGLLILLVLLWGTSFMFVSISVRSIEPLTTVTGRCRGTSGET